MKKNFLPKDEFCCDNCNKKKTEIPYNKNFKVRDYYEPCCTVYCVQCLTNQLEKYIEKNDNAFFKCKCSRDVDIFILEDVLGLESILFNKVFEKYQKKIATNAIANKPVDNSCCMEEKNNNCQDIIEDDCCGNNDECKENKENDLKEEDIEEKNNLNLTEEELNAKLIKEKGYKKCPNCLTLIEKLKGCNIIRCETEKCQKKIKFCYCCQELLKKQEHEEKHFPNGIFKACLNGFKNEKFN